MYRTARNAAYRLFVGIQALALFLIAVIGGMLKLETDKFRTPWLPALPDVIKLVQDNAWWLLIGLGASAGISRIACSQLGSPWVWKTVQSVIDQLREFAFIADGGKPSHYHRVTVFKRVSFKFFVWPWRSPIWPWGIGRGPFSGWLVPVARSGHTTKRTKTVFLAPDDADFAEGMAGLAWSCNDLVHKADLPDLEQTVPQESIEVYSLQTGLSVEMTQKRMEAGLPTARSFLAMSIEVSNKKWGVVVLDSRDPNGIKKPNGRNYLMYSVMAKFLGRLLERA